MILAFPSFKRPSLRRRAQVSIEAKQEAAAAQTSVLILGDHRQSLTVIRSLASAGFRVIFGSERASTVAAHSRFVSESWLHPPLLEAEEFVTTMVDFLEARGDVSHVFPVGESELDCLARHYARVSAHATLVMPEPQTVSVCLDKLQVYRRVSDLGLALPKTDSAFDLAQLLELAKDIRFPCIVKPRTSLHPFFGQKAVLCRTEEALTSSFAVWPTRQEALIVQAWVAGARYNCEFAAVNGRLVEYFEHKVVRSDRPDDLGVEVEGISVGPTKELQQSCEALLVDLGYSGVGCVQFLVNERNGTNVFLEINPRLDATCAFPWHYGCDLPRLAVEIAQGDKALDRFPGTLPRYPTSKRVHWCLGDVRGWLHEVKRGEVRVGPSLVWLAKIVASFLRANCHLTWWWKDPAPVVVLCRDLLAYAWRCLFRVSRKHTLSDRPVVN